MTKAGRLARCMGAVTALAILIAAAVLTVQWRARERERRMLASLESRLAESAGQIVETATLWMEDAEQHNAMAADMASHHLRRMNGQRESERDAREDMAVGLASLTMDDTR